MTCPPTLTILGCAALAGCAATQTPQSPDSTAPPSQGVPFAPSLEVALERAGTSGRPVVLIFGAVWCPSCRLFKRDTLTAPEVIAHFDSFEWVYVDVDREHSLSQTYGVRATPQFVVLAPDGRRVAEDLGDPGPEGFSAFLVEVRTRAADAESEPLMHESEERTDLTWTPKGYRGRSICFSHVGYGPLNVPSQSPASVLRLALNPRTPSTLGKGQYELKWSETLANFFAHERGEYRLDYGALYSTLALGYGISDTMQVELEMIDFRRFDSVLDDLTNAFHDLFGLDDAGRDEFDDGENVIFLNGLVDSQDEQRYSQDLAFTFQHNITCGTEKLPALAWALTMRTNTGGSVDLDGSSDLSVGLSVSASRRFGEKWYGYTSLGHVWHGLDEWRGIPLEDSQLSFLVAGEYRYAPRCSWVAQYLLTEEVTARVSPFDKPTHELNIGWKYEISPGTVLELGVLENAFVVDNSPDVGLHFGLTHRF